MLPPENCITFQVGQAVKPTLPPQLISITALYLQPIPSSASRTPRFDYQSMFCLATLQIYFQTVRPELLLEAGARE